jgi:choline dehydrogenase-like flavoprotein
MPVARNSMPNPKFKGNRGYLPASAVGNDFSGQRCQGNSSCSPMCPVQAKYNALKSLEAAKRAGKVEVRSQCVVSKLIIDSDSGRITGVEYKRYEAPGQAAKAVEIVSGKVVVLAANAIENAVLSLASGIVDRSGQLGRNLMDHPYINLYALAPEPTYPFRGPDTTSGVESLRDGKFREKHAAFRGGMGNWGWGGEPASTVANLLKQSQFGKSFRKQLDDRLTRMFKIGVMIEQLPDANNRVTIDPDHTDLLGNYLPILTYDYADYTLDAALAVIGTF